MIQRQPKKSETVEFRLPHETKTAFAGRCRAQGRTVSEALRQLIERELQVQSSPRPRGPAVWRIVVAALLGGLALGTVAAPSLAQSLSHGSPSRAAFQALDSDGDGVLSFDEFRAR